MNEGLLQPRHGDGGQDGAEDPVPAQRAEREQATAGHRHL